MLNAIHSATNSPELGHRAVVDLHIWDHSQQVNNSQNGKKKKRTVKSYGSSATIDIEDDLDNL
jgi:hypothetical protein